MALNIRLAVLAFGVAMMLSVEASFFTMSAKGPLYFVLADYSLRPKVLTRTKDICEVYVTQTRAPFHFGNNSYDQITVCGNGYIIPGVSGTAETASPAVNSSDFDNPETPLVAVGLIANDRDDGLFDMDCISRRFYASLLNSDDNTCAAAATAASLFYTEINILGPLQNSKHNITPEYDPAADNANIIQEWIASVNPINYASFVTNSGSYGNEVKTSIFSGPNDTAANFAPRFANNVISDSMSSSEKGTIEALTGDANFISGFGYCFSWYKVGQPPEVIDHFNTFQLVLACSSETSSSPVDKCVALFDYFELGYTEQNGQVMRAGATGPGLSK